jgi:hypothetical protein
VRDAADPALAAAHRLFAMEFEEGELVSLRDWRNLIRERAAGLWTDVAWHVLVAERAGRVIGAATGSYLGNVNVGIIGYIAVRPGARRLGLGPRLRGGLRRAFERDARRIRRRPLEALVGEVREDNPWLRHLVRREGAIALDFPYLQPSIRGKPPVPLVLYYQSLGRARASLPTPMVRRLLYTMWRRPYRVAQPLSKRSFRLMLRALRGRRRIGQRALPPPTPRRRAVE